MKNSIVTKMFIIAMAIIAAGIVIDLNKGNYLSATLDTAVLILDTYILFNYFKD